MDATNSSKLTYTMPPNFFLKNGLSSSTGDLVLEEDTNGALQSPKTVTFLQPSSFMPSVFERSGLEEPIDLSSKSSTNPMTRTTDGDVSPEEDEPRKQRRRLPLLPSGLEAKLSESGQYVCMFCSKTFIHKYPYRDHVKTHTGDSPRCPTCFKPFPKNHNLKLHMRTHTGEKPFRCPVHGCLRGFADKSNLKVHLRCHTGERPYKCEFCNENFVNSSRLLVHRRIHTGEKPFSCSACNALFATKHQMLVHSKCHGNQEVGKPYRCFHCGAGYSQGPSLKSHIVSCKLNVKGRTADSKSE